MSTSQLLNAIFSDYNFYHERSLNAKLIRHSDISELLDSLKGKDLFKVERLGKSVEGRDISAVVFGSGDTNILAWSQMHGDEPTATAALFDVMNFFSSDDSHNEARSELLNSCKFHLIPLLNPDGAEVYKRENAFNIDLNRDASRLESHESAILWDYAERIQPEFCFNLHDQNSYYTAGFTDKHSTISLLAPASDHVKSIGYAREQSMQVILKIKETLDNYIPEQTARYNDEHEPRSFGDNFIRKGFSSILIESGYHKSDPDKEFVRKLNFIALLSAFESISGKNYTKINYTEYFSIPENQQLLFDLLLRNLTLNFNGNNFRVDIGIKRKKKWEPASKQFVYTGTIAEIGDLSIFSGIDDHNMAGYRITSPDQLITDSAADLVIEGEKRIVIKNGFILGDTD
ncbi:MAG: M14 family zinc carboxypeptidase [Melioribacteraceae bacterium]